MSDSLGFVFLLSISESGSICNQRKKDLPLASSLVEIVVGNVAVPIWAWNSRSGAAGDLINSTRVARLAGPLHIRHKLTLRDQHGDYHRVKRIREARVYRGTRRMVEGAG
jgi:hypothetical protein